MSIRAIADRLDVAKSSVSLWVRDVPLSAEQEAALQAADPVRNGRLIGTRVYLERCRARRLEAQALGRASPAGAIRSTEAAACSTGPEGSKTRNCVQLVNADADLLDTFLAFLRDCHAVADQAVTFSVNCFLGNGLTLREIEHWWLARLGLPSNCVRTAAVNRPSSASLRKRGHTLPHGQGV